MITLHVSGTVPKPDDEGPSMVCVFPSLDRDPEENDALRKFMAAFLERGMESE